MKKIKFLSLFLCFVLIFGNVNAFAKTEYDITETYVRFLGRGETTNNGRSFNYPQSGFEMNFSGTKVEVYVTKVAVASYNDCYFNVSVDGNAPERIKMTDGWNTIYENSENTTEHQIQFIRSSEAIRGKLYINKISTEGGEPTPTLSREKKMEFYGDSYTVGYGNRPELDSTGYTALNTDHWYSYASVTARYFNADANVIAYSGRGLCVNENGTAINTISNQFNSSDLRINNDSYQSVWDFNKYTPNIVVLFLGTNDAKGISQSGSGFTANDFYNSYMQMLKNIRAKYPKANIICCSKATGACMENEVTKAVQTFGGENKGVYRIVFNPFGTSTFNHPNVSEHQQIANQLINFIEENEGIWDGYTEEQTPVKKDTKIVKTKVYIDEDYSGYVSNGDTIPNNWYSIKLKKNGHVSLSDIYSVQGSTQEADDKAVSFMGTSAQRIIRKLDDTIPAGNEFYVDFDVYRQDGEKWYMYLLPEYDLEYDSEMHTSSSSENVDSNVFIGMYSDTVLGYANQKTNNSVLAFNNGDSSSYNYQCEVPTRGWHHISVYVKPISRTSTIIKASVDYGDEYTQETRLNYSTAVEAIKGVGIAGLAGEKDVRFDNIVIYEGTYPPEVSNVEFTLGGKEQKDEISPLTDSISIEFSGTILDEEIENAIAIKDKSGVEIPFTYNLSDDKRTINISLDSRLKGNTEYTLKVSGIKDITGNASMTDDYVKEFTTTALGDCKIVFLDKNDSQIGTQTKTPYGLKSIKVDFGIAVDFDDAKNKIKLYKGEKKIPVEYRPSDDYESVILELGNDILDVADDYYIDVEENILLKDYEISTDKHNKYTFEVTDDNVVIETEIYYENDFNNYKTSGLPAGFYRYNPNDNNVPGTINSIAHTENEDRAINFAGDVNQLIRTQLDKVVEYGMPFTVKFDICRNNDNGFYIDLMPECDVRHLTDAIHTDSKVEDYHTQDRNVAIGMHSTVKTGSGSVNSPHLGYANAKRSGSGLLVFKDDKQDYCDIPSDGLWHTVVLDVRPISEESTYLTVSVDGGKKFETDSKLDFVSQRFAGLGLFAIYNDNTTGAKLINNSVSFDNIRVYSKSEVKTPVLEDIELINYDDTVQDINKAVSVATKKITLRFDTAVSEDSIKDNVKLISGTEEIPYDYSMSVDCSKVTIKHRQLFDCSTTYKIEVLNGITSMYDARMKLKDGKTVYFRTENRAEDINAVTDFSASINNNKAVVSADVLKLSDEGQNQYTLMIAEYKTITSDKNNNLQIDDDECFNKLISIKYLPINLNEYQKGIYNFNQEVLCNADTEFVIGYIMEFPSNNVLRKYRVDVK